MKWGREFCETWEYSNKFRASLRKMEEVMETPGYSKKLWQLSGTGESSGKFEKIEEVRGTSENLGEIRES